MEPQNDLCDHFLRWQCLIRKYAITRDGGRPSAGMRPEVVFDDGESLGASVVMIVKQHPEVSTAEFKHTYKRTQDPMARIEHALKLLATEYYRQSAEFSDQMTALYSADSAVATKLIKAGKCRLMFNQNSQQFDLFCDVRALRSKNPAYQATYWHNSMFNPNLPGAPIILGFRPDWSVSQVDPALP